MPYPAPAELRGPINLGFMYLPMYRGWVIVVLGRRLLRRPGS